MVHSGCSLRGMAAWGGGGTAKFGAWTQSRAAVHSMGDEHTAQLTDEPASI